MDIEAYIQSGIIESCVLQLATEAEQHELELLCTQYPVIFKAKQSFELALENQLVKEGLKPAEDLKHKIFQNFKEPGLQIPFTRTTEYVTLAGPGKTNPWKWLAAACFILLAGTLYWTYSINNKYQSLRRSIIETANTGHSSHAGAVLAFKSIVEKPSIKWSMMTPPANASHCMAHVYWDTLSKDTYLLLGNMPPKVADKQFQLWAIANDHAVDLGIFDVKAEGKLIKMKNVAAGKIFVITLEPKGGSRIPNMDARYAVAEL